jgi:hypothetical protein
MPMGRSMLGSPRGGLEKLVRRLPYGMGMIHEPSCETWQCAWRATRIHVVSSKVHRTEMAGAIGCTA